MIIPCNYVVYIHVYVYILYNYLIKHEFLDIDWLIDWSIYVYFETITVKHFGSDLNVPYRSKTNELRASLIGSQAFVQQPRL